MWHELLILGAAALVTAIACLYSFATSSSYERSTVQPVADSSYNVDDQSEQNALLLRAGWRRVTYGWGSQEYWRYRSTSMIATRVVAIRAAEQDQARYLHSEDNDVEDSAELS